MACLATTQAQQFNSAYFTDGYLYQHDINPAMGNDNFYIGLPIVGNTQVKLQGNFGYDAVVMDNPYYPQRSNKSLATFLHPAIDASSALSGFSSGANKLQTDLRINVLSIGFKGFGGYNTIEVTARAAVDLQLPYELFEMAKNIGNKSYDMDNISARAQSFAELAFGHSHDINEKLRVGAKAKLLFGLGRADVELSDVHADLTDAGQWRMTMNANANVSIKGFEYETHTKSYESQAGTYDYVGDIDVDGYGLSGFGVAFDLGADYKINDDWRVSASLIDLGFIRWTNNMQATNRSKEFIFNGFHDTSVHSNAATGTIDDQVDSYTDQIYDFIRVEDEGDQGSRTTGIGATINLAGEYTLPCYRKLSFGLLSSTRLQGDYSWTEARLSANYEPFSWLSGNINAAVNSYATSAGFLLNIKAKPFNFFIGMDHILGKTSKEMIPLSSNASVAFGFNTVL